MGYYVELIDANFYIPETENVLQVLKDLNQRDDLKRGGSWGPEGKTKKWFSWMPENYDQTMNSVKEIFEALGFETVKMEEITVERPYEIVCLTGYDSKIGQEDLFLKAVAPFVPNDSFLEWKGEDGYLWRHRVKDGQLYIERGKVVYGEPILVEEKP